MRRRVIVGLLVGTAGLVPSTASANGGAYLELDRTHYLPGETAVAAALVQIPERRQDLLDRGPFYAFVVPYGADLREGRPIPDRAIRVGTFQVTEGKRGVFELRASFTVPGLPGDRYRVALCNEPCTISGFAEPLSGEISIVGTEREADLLTANARLGGRVLGLRRQLRKAEKELEWLRTQLDLTAAEGSELRTRVDDLEERLRARPAAVRAQPGSTRPLLDPWSAVALTIAVVVLAALLYLGRRRSTRIRVPDTIEELEAHAEHPGPR